jgi:hypothetical protein
MSAAECSHENRFRDPNILMRPALAASVNLDKYDPSKQRVDLVVSDDGVLFSVQVQR